MNQHHQLATATTPTSANAKKGRPVIEIDGVIKVYGQDIKALSEISLTVHQGEFLSLLGPSGCGKSTLLKIMANLSPATGGRVRWWEQGADVIGDEGRNLSFVFQEATLMPWANVATNVRLPLDLSDLSRAEANTRVSEALELVGLDAFADVYPHQLSGGMQMRASIARALVTDPDVLLMDEPFGALDEITRHKLNTDLLRLWNERSLTIVFVTHSVYEAAYLSTRVCTMSARPGRVFSDVSLNPPEQRDATYRATEGFAESARFLSEQLLMASDDQP